jgi:TPR repeat protein
MTKEEKERLGNQLFNKGRYLEEGKENGKPDLDSAILWYEKAVKLGNTGAMINLGIIFDDLYLDLAASRQNVFEAMLMHEVGHMVNKHFDTEESSKEAMLKRSQYISMGKVDPKELDADRFAVEHCGKNAVMQMLDHMISVRRSRNTFDSPIAIMEAELRKRAVMRL